MVSEWPLLQRISGEEEQEEGSQGAIDEQQLLVPCHGVGAEPVVLILGEPSHHLHARHKLVLGGSAHGAYVLLRDFLHGGGGGRGGESGEERIHWPRKLLQMQLLGAAAMLRSSTGA